MVKTSKREVSNDEDVMKGKKKNGHKLNCGCHICENMKNKALRGGYHEERMRRLSGGTRKKNGHKMNCKCIICLNMLRSTSRRSRKKRGTNRRVK